MAPPAPPASTVPGTPPPPRVNLRQMQFLQDRTRRLNDTHRDVVMSTSHRPIQADALARVREINQTLRGLDHALRNGEAQRYLGEVYRLLGADEQAVVRELVKETLSLQGANVANNAIGLAPTLLGSLAPGVGAAAGAFAWSAAAQAYQPWLGVQIFNAAYFGFDFTRQAGMPGRSRQLEGARTLQQTLEQLGTESDALEASLAAAGAAEPGTPDAEASRQALVRARDAGKEAIDQRMRREFLDDSYDAGRWAQSTLSALKQLALYASQYVAYATSQECEGGKHSFYLQMGAVAAAQLLQLVAAPTDRLREGRRIMAGNLAYGDIQTKDDVRDMFRSPFTQKLWLIGDGIENRTDAALKQLAQQFNVSPKRLKQFEEAGGFNQSRFSEPLDDAGRQRLADFAERCDGAPIGGCNGALQELERLVVLEGLEKRQAAYVTDMPAETLQRTLGLASPDEAEQVRGGTLPDALRGQLDALRAKYDTRAGLAADDVAAVTRKDVLEWAGLARADGTVLTPLQAAVRDRLETKARTSTMNLAAWRGEHLSENEEENSARRDKSLTPLEHALLHALRVRPRIDAAATARAGHDVTDHALAAERIQGEPTSMARVRELLGELREHRMDKAMMPWDYSQLTPATTQAIADVLQGERSWLGNTRDAIATRWNMPGYTVPVIVVQVARATFMAVGGSGFFFFLQAGAGLARKTHPDTFACTPGEGPNDASKTFSHVMMAVSTAMLAFAMLGAWSGPQAVNTSRVRREYFTRPDGRPSFWDMMRANYLYSARRAVTDYAGQRLWSGPRAKDRAERLIAQAERQLDAMASPAAADTPDGIALAALGPARRTGRASSFHPAAPQTGGATITEIA